MCGNPAPRSKQTLTYSRMPCRYESTARSIVNTDIGLLPFLYYRCRCWCADCELTELETNTDFDRHGGGSCNTPCAGDPSSTCGGDLAISLYQSTTCREFYSCVVAPSASRTHTRVVTLTVVPSSASTYHVIHGPL